MHDIEQINANSGFARAQSTERSDFFYLKLNDILLRDTLMTVGLSILMVSISVFLLTVNLRMTLLVLFSVLLVDLFTLAIVHFWGLTFHFVIAVNLSFALGITVDYSAHIAHTFLMV